MEKKRGSFSGRLGFVLAAAGSAVGLGNLWRFPYLAAKGGGGIFLLVYIILTLTFGFALLVNEISLGRKTRMSAIRAYETIDKRFKFLGILTAVVPMLIFPYYCVIGGWVTKYSVDFIIGNGMNSIADSYFTGFITSFWPPIIWMGIFMGVTAWIVICGVEKGIEKFSKILMPALVIIVIGIAVFALTLSDPESGRTAIDGLKIYITPDFTGMTVGKFFNVLLDAMGQIFFSMSIAMGIMITYGSYAKKDTDLVKSVNHIEIFDTGVAILAGLIMIPTVYTFQGSEGLQAAGPSLLFVSMPKIFSEMGFVGNIVGAMFFILVLFAALTSSISILEAVVSMMMDKFGWSRKKSITIALIISVILALVTCFGYNIWYFEYKLPNGAVAQILDIFDYIINSFLMPIIALLTCVFVGWVCGTKVITDEVKINGEKFGRESLYAVMVKFIAPVCLILILMSAFGIFN